jgi:hypothetical protein
MGLVAEELGRNLKFRYSKWEFWAEARNDRPVTGESEARGTSSERAQGVRRARLRSLCERRGRHVTRSFCRPCRHPPAFPSDSSKNLRSALILPTHHSRFKFQRNFDDEPRDPTTISPLQVGPPAASSPPDAHPSSSIEKCYALLPISQYSNSLRVAKPTLNGITRAPTSSLPKRRATP